jgi:hypothetical protein
MAQVKFSVEKEVCSRFLVFLERAKGLYYTKGTDGSERKE